MITQLTFVHALSPLHPGVGQGAGVIDLPIARERATNIPYLAGSSLKGALRTRGTETSKLDKDTLQTIFGKEVNGDENGTASLVQFSDQRLLLFPVRSLAGTFAWVTCPFVVLRLARDCREMLGTVQPPALPLSLSPLESCCVTTDQSTLIPQGQKTEEQKIFLEDLDLQAHPQKKLEEWGEWLGQYIFPGQANWQEELKRRLCLVHDDVFSFLLETATEVRARIRIDEESKTVARGALWYEETLPAESVLTGIMVATTSPRNPAITDGHVVQAIKDLTTSVIQLGGKSTVGHGLCQVRIGKEEAQHANA